MRLTFTVSPTNEARSTRELLGVITQLNWDERDGGLFIFEHIEIEASRLYTKKSILNLASTIIWGIDILIDDYDTIHYFDCPSCRQPLALGVQGVQTKEEETTEEE